MSSNFYFVTRLPWVFFVLSYLSSASEFVYLTINSITSPFKKKSKVSPGSPNSVPVIKSLSSYHLSFYVLLCDLLNEILRTTQYCPLPYKPLDLSPKTQFHFPIRFPLEHLILLSLSFLNPIGKNLISSHYELSL